MCSCLHQRHNVDTTTCSCSSAGRPWLVGLFGKGRPSKSFFNCCKFFHSLHHGKIRHELRKQNCLLGNLSQLYIYPNPFKYRIGSVNGWIVMRFTSLMFNTLGLTFRHSHCLECIKSLSSVWQKVRQMPQTDTKTCSHPPTNAYMS